MRNRFLALFGIAALAASAQAASPTKTYADAGHHFSVEYPAAWRLDQTTHPNTGPADNQPLIAFAVPNNMAKGTNLSSESRISIETVSKGTCSAARFLEDGADTKTVRENGVRNSVGNFGEGAAGNYYEQTVYALENSKPCFAVRLFIHSTNIGNYDPGTVREFDRKALDAVFDNIRHSLKITR